MWLVTVLVRITEVCGMLLLSVLSELLQQATHIHEQDTQAL